MATTATMDAILVADDELGVRESLAEVLRDAGYRVEAVADGAAALTALEQNDFSVVITDLRMPGADGLTVLKKARETSPQAIVFIMTAHATVESTVDALRQGAVDYILKPVIFDDVLGKVERALAHRQLVWEAQHLRHEADERYDFGQLVGRGPQMTAVFQLVQKVAPTNTTVLITGESGTGKEVVARAIHHYSAVASKIFLPVNCAAIPETLLESHLFGHVRGAFTGAVSAQEGLFARARGGTIFLDEIGEMPLGLQSKLLRAIETKEILPVGSTEPVRVDVRIIAASNRDLKAMAEEGTFRADLYYRLAVVEMTLPPLRERREDIPALVEYLVRRHNREMTRAYRGVDNAAMRVLMGQPWKGNVRELDNAIEHAMIVGDGEWIHPQDLPRGVQSEPGNLPPLGDDLREAMQVYERLHIESVLKRAQGDKRQAAERLGVSLSSLYRKLDELHIGLGR